MTGIPSLLRARLTGRAPKGARRKGRLPTGSPPNRRRKMKSKSRYTPAEHARAREMFQLAKERGVLKAPRGIGVLALTNRPSQAFSADSTTYQDYLPDARSDLKSR